jgi:hypothetical protein
MPAPCYPTTDLRQSSAKMLVTATTVALALIAPGELPRTLLHFKGRPSGSSIDQRFDLIQPRPQMSVASARV